MKFSTTLACLFAVVPGALTSALPKVQSRGEVTVPYSSQTINSAAWEVFKASEIRVAGSASLTSRQTAEPDPNRNQTNPDHVFVLQCTNGGFRGDCLVFGSDPGACVSYFDFQPNNSTFVSDVYNDKVSSFSTNTGGVCQFYKFKGCNNKGDDRGLSKSYVYNLAVPLPEDTRIVEYENEITSWRC